MCALRGIESTDVLRGLQVGETDAQNYLEELSHEWLNRILEDDEVYLDEKGDIILSRLLLQSYIHIILEDVLLNSGE